MILADVHQHERDRLIPQRPSNPPRGPAFPILRWFAIAASLPTMGKESHSANHELLKVAQFHPPRPGLLCPPGDSPMNFD